MRMRALLAGSAVLVVGVVACSSAHAATASPAAPAARHKAAAAVGATADRSEAFFCSGGHRPPLHEEERN